MFTEILRNVREKSPLVHNITNYVTVNDVANIILACGASPIMADDAAEVEEITSICTGLNINIGTLNARTIASMFLAGKKANELGHPALLDPVGVGASKLRTETALKLAREIHFNVIRGNMSEIRMLDSAFLPAGGEDAHAAGNTEGTAAEGAASESRGVDASISDRVTEENLDAAVRFVKSFAAKADTVCAVTGAIDIVADRDRAFCIRNGHPMMSSITGTGCQLSGLTTAFIAANPDKTLEAAAAAVCLMGAAGEIAQQRLTSLDGNSSYRNYIIDAIFRMTPEELERLAKYEIR